MSVPVVAAGIAATLLLSLTAVTAAGVLEAKERVAGAADAAALAAADALGGWSDEAPCPLAAQVLRAADAVLVECSIDQETGSVRLQASLETMLGTLRARARAGPPFT